MWIASGAREVDVLLYVFFLTTAFAVNAIKEKHKTSFENKRGLLASRVHWRHLKSWPASKDQNVPELRILEGGIQYTSYM
jgi:hypothetical protein